jgi:hypothetical protein
VGNRLNDFRIRVTEQQHDREPAALQAPAEPGAEAIL